MKKTLVNLLGGVTLLSLVACSQSPEYHFEGKIGKEQVKFYESLKSSLLYEGFLEVTKKNGDKIEYNSGRDLKLDWIKITIGNNTTYYNIDSENEKVKEILDKGQINFDMYLDKIHKTQTSPLNNK